VSPVEAVQDANAVPRRLRCCGDIKQPERLEPEVVGGKIVDVRGDHKDMLIHNGFIVTRLRRCVKTWRPTVLNRSDKRDNLVYV
jgi:hypothetical protein